MQNNIFNITNSHQSLLSYLIDQKIFLPAYCGGKGICGKCKVHFVTDAPEPSLSDLKFFSEEELKEGWRLACTTYAKGELAIEIPDYKEEDIVAEEHVDMKDFHSNKRAAPLHQTHGFENKEKKQCTSFEKTGINQSTCLEKQDKNQTISLENEVKPENSSVSDKRSVQKALCIDIGTTTIVAALYNRTTEEVEKIVSSVNHQRSYGTDVISRIESATKGHGPALQECILQDLTGLCHRLGVDDFECASIGNHSRMGGSIFDVEIPVIISGNTTMEHLLEGLDCSGLGVYPFTPVDISLHKFKNMWILPGISTYVGGDIVSGIVACGMDQSEDINVLMDIGTNGEMVIGNKDRMLVASVAAGPAFEGGNILHGIAGVPGAIDTVVIEDGVAKCTTIGGEKPIGICGTGVLETVYELVKEEIVDETGLLDDEYFDDGYPLAPGITFAAKDVREVQLAKSAIRAGLEVLIQNYGVEYDQIKHIYLAGGFGQKINIKKAVGIGLLPEELVDRVVPVGNSSLKGAIMMAQKEEETADRMKQLVSVSEEIALSSNSLFTELYMGYMFFGEE